MRARLTGWRVLEPDPIYLETWQPPDPTDFVIDLDFYACPEGEDGADAFTVRICSPKWFFRHMGDGITSDAGILFMPRFDARAIIGFLEDACLSADAETWTGLAVQLGRIGRWEFDYQLDYIG
ncbi:Imm8 family immunity protein [Ancylobacter terrae]|uniref:Imm8 family immunity protein n=1 Tax=Ancylobacter sp. sgz301288 TaxID=3342077 RepID=UPI00385E9A63